MKLLKQLGSKLSSELRGAPNRKSHLDFLAALLSIPVLLSVIILNFGNIQGAKKSESNPNPAPTEKIIIIPQKDIGADDKTGIRPTTSPSPTITQGTVTQAACKKQIGPISISYPSEGATIKDSPVWIIINYEDETYCSVVWSYRINGGTWSNYNSNSVGLYNLPSGPVKFELRVQSTTSSDQKMLERNFTYEAPASSSANIN